LLVDAYPRAGRRPVALDGPAVGAEAAIPLTMAPVKEVARAGAKIGINIMADRATARTDGELTEGGLPGMIYSRKSKAHFWMSRKLKYERGLFGSMVDVRMLRRPEMHLRSNNETNITQL